MTKLDWFIGCNCTMNLKAVFFGRFSFFNFLRGLKSCMLTGIEQQNLCFSQWLSFHEFSREREIYKGIEGDMYYNSCWWIDRERGVLSFLLIKRQKKSFIYFGWNFQVIFTLPKISLNTNKFLDWVSRFLDITIPIDR